MELHLLSTVAVNRMKLAPLLLYRSFPPFNVNHERYFDGEQVVCIVIALQTFFELAGMFPVLASCLALCEKIPPIIEFCRSSLFTRLPRADRMFII